MLSTGPSTGDDVTPNSKNWRLNLPETSLALARLPVLTASPSAAGQHWSENSSTGARIPRHVVAPLNHMAQYLSGPILTRSQGYDVSSLRQRKALVQTFHMVPNSLSDATYFLGNGQHMHAASMTRYFMWPIPTRSQCYDVSALHQRQALLMTFHKTPISVSDALYFLGYRQHMHATRVCQTGRFNTCARVKVMMQN